MIESFPEQTQTVMKCALVIVMNSAGRSVYRYTNWLCHPSSIVHHVFADG